MKEYFASRVVRVAEVLAHCKLCTVGEAKRTEETQKEIQEYLGSIDKELKYLGLELTRVYADRIRSVVPALVVKNTIVGELIILDGRFRDELASIHFFHVPSNKLRFYSRTDLFGDQFKTNFPKANSEIIEAGSCFAFDRYTACVFHLMRAMEIVVRVLFVSLGMPPRIWGATKWKSILDRISRKIAKNDINLANDLAWQADRHFYETAHAFLSAIRAPIRNSTMHVESVYDEPGAENVFDSVKAFMRHAATKLNE